MSKAYKYTPEMRKRALDLKNKTVGDCGTCNGAGYVPVPNTEGQVMRCECMVVFQYLRELLKAGIPQGYWSLTFVELEIDEAYKELVKVYLDNLHNAISKGLGMIFLGPNGIGKTSLMCEIGKEAIIKHYDVRYFTLTQYIRAVQTGDEEARADMERGKLLLVDELDKQYIKPGSDFVVKTLDEALRTFLSAGKSLIMSTNWTERELLAHFGESTGSLLQRYCETLVMGGSDYSPKKQESFWDELRDKMNYFDEVIVESAWAHGGAE